jgi:hypothetical protein
MPTEITCPSGLRGTVRNLTVKDGRFLTDRNATRSGEAVDQILQACWTEALDLGLYGEGELKWKRVLVGDRDFALVRIRALTYGEAYEFPVKCRSCPENFVWEVNLSDLPVRILSDASKARFRDGNAFETKLPGDGRVVIFKLPTGEDQTAQAKKIRAQKKQARATKDDDEDQSEGNLLLSALEMRIKKVENVEAKALRDFLETLSLGQMTDLLDDFEAQDCGIETSIEVECPNCDRVQSVSLPFDEGFFFPRKKRAAATTTK